LPLNNLQLCWRCVEVLQNMNRTLSGKVILVTGASAGIGEALAREAAAQGAAVVLAARRLDRLQRIAAELQQAGGQALAVACDVTRDGEVEAAVRAALDRFGRLDVVLANAGFAVSGALARIHLDDYRRQMELNLFGVLRTIYATLPALTESRGALGIVGSANGYLSVAGASAYCASKHAVRSLATCLRHELRPRGVSVTHLAPGFITSELRQIDNLGQHHAEARDPVPRWLQMPAPRAARQMLAAVMRRRAEKIVTFHARAAIFLERHAPWLVSAVLRLSGSLARDLGSKPSAALPPAETAATGSDVHGEGKRAASSTAAG
jgi:NADP-dependent 3-hydroxy acid dehydrogenase YdfG